MQSTNLNTVVSNTCTVSISSPKRKLDDEGAENQSITKIAKQSIEQSASDVSMLSWSNHAAERQKKLDEEFIQAFNDFIVGQEIYLEKVEKALQAMESRNFNIFFSPITCQSLDEDKWNKVLKLLSQMKGKGKLSSSCSIVISDFSTFTLKNLEELERIAINFNKLNTLTKDHLTNFNIRCNGIIIKAYKPFIEKALDNLLNSAAHEASEFVIEDVEINGEDLRWIIRDIYADGKFFLHVGLPKDFDTVRFVSSMSAFNKRYGGNPGSNFIDKYWLQFYIDTPESKKLDLLKFILIGEGFNQKIKELAQVKLDKFIGQSLANYQIEPFTYRKNYQIFEHYGNLVKSLKLSLEEGLVEDKDEKAQLLTLFPNVTKFSFESERQRGLWEKAMSLFKQQIKGVNIYCLTLGSSQTEKPKLDLSLLNDYRSIETFRMKKRENDDDIYIEIMPFKAPEELVHLSELQLCNCDSIYPKMMDSIAKLPSLRKLTITNSKDINLHLFEKNILHKLENLGLKNSKFSLNYAFKGQLIKVSFPLSFYKISEWQKQFPSLKIDIKNKYDALDQDQEIEQIEKIWLQDNKFNIIQLIDSANNSNPFLVGMLETPTNETLNQLIDSIKPEVKYLKNINIFDDYEGSIGLQISKMRYRDILPYVHNSLTKELGFIFNGSKIKSLDGRTRIASQGPLNSTIGDFWSAIWNMNTSLIVMTTSCKEEGKEKCAMYWPESVSTYQVYEDSKGVKTKVTFKQEESNLFELEKLATIRMFEIKQGKESRIIRQLHVDYWTDQSAIGATQLDALIDKIEILEGSDKKGSTLLHCSAGVGRTGVVIACQLIKQALKHTISSNLTQGIGNLRLDIRELLIYLRKQRAGMIQTPNQLGAVISFFKKQAFIYIKGINFMHPLPALS